MPQVYIMKIFITISITNFQTFIFTTIYSGVKLCCHHNIQHNFSKVGNWCIYNKECVSYRFFIPGLLRHFFILHCFVLHPKIHFSDSIINKV